MAVAVAASRTQERVAKAPAMVVLVAAQCMEPLQVAAVRWDKVILVGLNILVY